MNKNLQITKNNLNNYLNTRPLFSLITLSTYAWFFAGFTHSDGSFFINYKISKSGVNFSFNFYISLGISSKDLIIEIANYFGCGNIYYTKTNCIYSVNNFLELWHIIIPHFIKYPMFGTKFNSFLNFVYCLCLCYPFLNKSKPINIILEVIRISYWMNEGTQRTLNNYYKLLEELNIIYTLNKQSLSLIPYDPRSMSINLYNNLLYLDLKQIILPFYFISLNYIKGIFEGDGSFIISFKARLIYSFVFNITTSINDLPILYLIQSRLGCGKVYIKSSTWCRFEVNKINDLNNIIIPLVDSLELYRGNGKILLCSKSKTYSVWREGIKKHLNNEIDNSISMRNPTEVNLIKREELKKFIKKAYNAFEGGKKRKLNLSEFLTLHNLND